MPDDPFPSLEPVQVPTFEGDNELSIIVRPYDLNDDGETEVTKEVFFTAQILDADKEILDDRERRIKRYKIFSTDPDAEIDANVLTAAEKTALNDLIIRLRDKFATAHSLTNEVTS